MPSHAYVPGRTARHDERVFDTLHASVRPGMTVAELGRSAAFRAGLEYYARGYFWEAHEALEPVWMALPEGSADRARVQALIQLANAALKQAMGRPNATLRLCARVMTHLDASDGASLPIDADWLRREAEVLLAGAKDEV
jgi:hypothetical protein